MEVPRVSWTFMGFVLCLWICHMRTGFAVTWAPSVGLNQLPFTTIDSWSRNWVQRQPQPASIGQILRMLLRQYGASDSFASRISTDTLNRQGSFNTWTTTGIPLEPAPNSAYGDQTNGLHAEQPMPSFTSGILKSTRTFHKEHISELNNQSMFVPNQTLSNGVKGNRQASGSDGQNVSMVTYSSTVVTTAPSKEMPSSRTKTAENANVSRVSAHVTNTPGPGKRSVAVQPTAADKNTSTSNNTKVILSKIRLPTLVKLLNTIDNKGAAKESKIIKCDKGCPIPDMCNNGGTCINTCSGFTCMCREGFTGFFCDTETNSTANFTTMTTESQTSRHEVTTPVMSNATSVTIS